MPFVRIEASALIDLCDMRPLITAALTPYQHQWNRVLIDGSKSLSRVIEPWLILLRIVSSRAKKARPTHCEHAWPRLVIHGNLRNCSSFRAAVCHDQN